MNKNEWLEIIQIFGNLLMLVGGGYVMKAKKAIDDFESLKTRVDSIEKSLSKSWEKIDNFKKKLPHGGEI